MCNPSRFNKTRTCIRALLVLCVLAWSSTALAQSFTLTINTLGSGTVSANPAGPYAPGTVVTLTATPSSGWSFSSWSGNRIGYANPAMLIVNGNTTVTATFNQIGYAGVTGDSRTVTEPVFPSVCTTLLAQQAASALNQSLFDTSRLQTAINNCPAGQAVELALSGSNNAFLTQPIVLKAGVMLLIDAEITLFGSNNKADYNCGSDCTPLIQVATNTGTPGSGIMGYGIIDGQGSVWWSGGDPRPRLVFVGDPATHASSDNFTFYKTSLQNSPKFNLYAISNGLTVWGAKVTNPGNSPNTDGIDPSGSTNVTIRDSYISTGDDHIAIKGGVGHVANMTITHNHLYNGHGLSVGSETNAGVENLLVTDNVIDQNGCTGCSSSNDVRIKSDSSRGGEVKNVLYQDLCIRNATTQSHEFVFNPFYTSATGSLIPNFHDIHLQNVHMVDAGNTSTFEGFDTSKVLTVFMDNVVWTAFNSKDFASATTSNAAFTLGPGPVSFASMLTADAPSDANVAITNSVANNNPAYDCTGRFVYLAGELFTKTPTVAAGTSATLTSVLQPIISGAAAPTGTISILEGSTVVATANIGGRITSVSVPNITAGTHKYIASYSGDSHYAQLDFGQVTVTTSGGGGGDFTLTATPSSQTANASGTASYTATASSSGGFAGNVSLSVSGLPAGATGSFNPASVAGSGSSALSVSTNSTTPLGTYALTITGTSGSLVHSTTVTLVVTAAPNFSIAASPASQTVNAGAGTSYTTSLTALNGFTGSVNLSVSGLPSGATGSFNPTSVAGSGSSTLSVSTSSTTPAGTYTLTITGTSGSLMHSATTTLVVNSGSSTLFTFQLTSVTPNPSTIGTSTKVAVRFNDVGTGTTAKTFHLAFQVIDPSGKVVTTHSADVSMVTGNSHDSTQNFTPATRGTYIVQGTVTDSSTGSVLAQTNNMGTFQVN